MFIVAVPKSWQICYAFDGTGRGLTGLVDVRGICPHCGVNTTFEVRAFQQDIATPQITVYATLRCNYARCKQTVYVQTRTDFRSGGMSVTQSRDDFFMHPPAEIDPPHLSLPANIADDWREAQQTLQSGNPKAAAVMLRRVLYGVLIDKGCKLKPLKAGVQDLITLLRLPSIFDDWLPAIVDDGHDGAHPDRALTVSTENITETREYTAELLRYVYIEPFEFQQRKARNSQPASP